MPEKYQRITGSFSSSGNDSKAYLDNYERIFGHSEPLKGNFLKKRNKNKISPLIKMRRLTS